MPARQFYEYRVRASVAIVSSCIPPTPPSGIPREVAEKTFAVFLVRPAQMTAFMVLKAVPLVAKALERQVSSEFGECHAILACDRLQGCMGPKIIDYDPQSLLERVFGAAAQAEHRDNVATVERTRTRRYAVDTDDCRFPSFRDAHIISMNAHWEDVV